MPHRRRWLAIAVIGLLAACAEKSPLAPTEPPGPPGGDSVHADTVDALQKLTCTAQMESPSVVCMPPAMLGASRRTSAFMKTARGDLVIDGQQVYVMLTPSNAAYDAGTQRFTFDMTVQNFIPQPLGTSDGTTLDPKAIRIFFASAPVVTVGTGSVSVMPDGVDTYSDTAQGYYQYDEVLAENAISSAKKWTLLAPASAKTFTFLLYVSGALPHPEGYVDVASDLTTIRPGEHLTLAATPRSAVGIPLTDPPAVTWSSSDESRATVSSSGVVTGVSAGSVTIRATNGVHSGEVDLTVTGATRVWSGAASTSWTDPANWEPVSAGTPAAAPAAVDSVSIPGGAPRFPVLAGNANIAGVTVANGASVSLGAFDLIAAADVRTSGSGAIVSTTGQLQLAGTNMKVAGTVPRLLVTGKYSLAGDLSVSREMTVQKGELLNAGYLLSQKP